MNHIYKVIWNKAKHCYTVVSEIAKSHSTSSVTKKKVSIAAILVAGMLSGFSPMVSGAADTTNSEAVVYDQNKTSLKSTNSNGVGKNAIALGKGAFAVGDSIAIGNGAYTQDGNREKGQSVALGNGAVTGAKSTSIGSKAIGGREGTITIGANANNGALYSTVVGTDSKITSDGKAYTATLPFVGKKSVIVQGAVSTSYGAHNTITNEKKVFSGVANSISGSANTVTNSNGVTIQGTGNTVSNAYKDMDISWGDLWNFSDGDYSSLAKKDSGAIAIIGGGNTISNQTSSTVIGVGNILKGENSTGVFTAGSHNTLTNVSNSLVMGDNNTLEGRKNVISLGNKNTVTADEAVAIGNGTTVSVESGVAIGVGSVANRVAESEKGARGEFAPDTIPTGQESTWTSTKGAVSVGDTANNITRQITNVAAGREDTDAVNVAQLKRAKTTVSDGTNTKVTSTVAEDGHADYKVDLNKDLTGIESMTNGSSSIRMGNGGTVTINNKVTIDQSGKISGVAAGEISSTSTDAVNGSQLHAVKQEAGKHTKVVNGSNITVEETDQDGQKTYKVGLNKDINVNSVQTNALNSKYNLSVGTAAADGKMPFFVNSNGAFYAAGGEFVVDKDGSVKATSGDIGNVKLNDGVFYKNTALRDGELYVGDADGNYSQITPKSAKLGQVTIDEKGNMAGVNSIQTNALNAKYNLSVGTANENGTVPFFVNSNGAFYAANGKLVVDKDGKVTATEGEIGNVVLKNGVLYKNTALRDGELYVGDADGNYSQITPKSAKLGQVTIDEKGNMAGVNSVQTNALNAKYNLSVGTAAADGKMPFFVNSNGAFYAAGGEFVVDKDGSVKATSGDIGNVKLNDGVFYKNSALRDGELYVGDADGNYSQITTKGAKLGQVTIAENGKIHGVTAGTADTDAVNVSQLKAVNTTANMGWNLATNGVATEATNVKPGDFVDFSGDKNISVSHDGTKVQVELNKNIDVNYVQTNALNAKYNLSVGTANENGIMPFFVNSNGAFYGANNNFSVDKDGKVTATAGEIGNVVLQNGVYTGHSALRDGELFVGDASGSYSQITPKSAKLGQVTIDEKGNIAGVNSIQTNALNAKYNLSVGTANENGIMPFFVNSNGAFYGANNNFSVDKDGKVTATAGEIGNVVLQNGVYTGHSALRDGELFVGDASGNYSQITTKGAKLGKVTVAEDGKISGVAAGAVTADSTDAVNGSQLHAVATEAGKHSKVVNGSNINVEETDVDGQKIYKVGLNDDILLGKLTGNNVSISGTNGTIETTGYIATKDRIIADKGAQLADITVSGNAISNGEAKVALDGAAGTAGMINGKGASLYMQDGTTVINNKVGIDQEGKITGVAAGEISATSKDAVNGSQLKQTNDKVDALDKRVTQNEADIKQNKADIAQNKADIAQNKADIAQNKADIAQNKADIQKNTVAIEQNKTDIATNKENINKLDTRVTNVEELAKKHTTVAAGDNITVTEGTNKDGGKNYTVAMKKDITVDSVKAGDTTINTEGVRIGDTTSLKKDSLTIGGKTYVTDKGLNANNQTITNVADGKVEKGSKDAINGSQLFATNQQVAQNAQSISKLGNRINKVGAGAAALAALHPLDFDPDDKWDFAAGYGNYNGENAAAIGAYYRPNEDTMFSVGGSFGNGENMVNAGVSLKLGQGNHVSTSKVAMAKEIKDLRKELEGLKSALLDVNAGKKLDTSKLQLFPDVPKNHWAYEYVSTLKGNGMLTGYPDGEFKGDRPMTRYEFATMLYKAMLEGATLSDKILKEFAPELERFTVDTVHQDKDGKPTVERVRTVKAEK